MANYFDRFDPVPDASGDVNPPANEQPYTSLRPLRRSVPSDPSRVDSAEAMALAALGGATLHFDDEGAGALSAMPAAGHVPAAAANWLNQRLYGDAASLKQASDRLQDAVA